MRIFRRPGAGVLIAAVALLLTACGGLGSTSSTSASSGPVPELGPNQKVEITFESYNLASTAWSKTITALLGKFQQLHPNITVHAQPPQGSGSTGINPAASVQSQLVIGKAPDVAQLTFDELDYAVTKLKPHAVDEVAGKDAVEAAFGGPNPIAAHARTLAAWNGKTYGMPFVFSTPVLFYNADLFRKAGLDPDKPPANWADVQRDALAIKTATGDNGAYVDCLTKAATDWCAQALVRSGGGTVLSADRKTLTFADQPAIDTFTTFQQMVASGAMPNLAQSQATEAMSRGQLGMILETSSLQGTFQAAAAGKWDLRAAPMPSFGGKPAVPTNSGSALFIFSQDKAKQRAAWDLIKFLTSDEAYITISSQIGYLPLRTGLVNDPNGLKAWADKNPLIRPNLAQLDNLQPWVSFPGDNYVQIRDLMMQAIENVVFQGKAAKVTMAESQARATDLMPKS